MSETKPGENEAEDFPAPSAEDKPGQWIRETVARARERFARLPAGARPVVTRPPDSSS